MRLIPVLSEPDLSRAFAPFKKPGEETVRVPPREVPKKDTLFGHVSERFVATEYREPWHFVKV